MTCPILGAKSYAHFVDESTWGVLPGTPTYYFVPLISNGVRLRQEHRRSQAYAGLRQAVNKQLVFAMVSGQITLGLHGWQTSSVSLMQKFLDWGFEDQEDTCPPSKQMEWAEGPNVANFRCGGLRVNTANLTGSADSNDLILSLDLMGKTETAVATAQTRPNDTKKLVGALFRDITFEVDLAGGTDYTEVGIRGFTWNASANLAAVRENSSGPVDISANGDFAETFQFVLNKANDTYDDIRRDLTEATEISARLTLRALHLGTGGVGTEFSKAVITFPRLSFSDNERGGDRGFLSDTINLDVLKPMTSSNGHTIAYSDE